MQSIEEFVRENIEEINDKISNFKKDKLYNDTQIKEYLREKLEKEIEEKIEQLLFRLDEYNYVKSKIKNIANEYVYYESHLRETLLGWIYRKQLSDIENEVILSSIKATIKSRINNDRVYKFVESDMDKIGNKAIDIIKMKGFSNNIIGLNQGVMVANSGDSAQFLFVSRAILAGFNCSNVDVRSSRYDAIVDYDGTLLKVQVKGLSNDSISFKDRDRGGQGIDYTHERNRGQMITSEDCDIYVAVDKQVGICYIIPVQLYIDKMPIEKKLKAISIKEVVEYKENWSIIKQVAENKNKIVYDGADILT